MLLKKGLFKIKNSEGRAVGFTRNPVQRDYNLRKSKSIKRKRMIVKARQMGFTTDAGITLLDKAMTQPYYAAFITAPNRDTVGKIFQEKIKFPFETLPKNFKSLWSLVRDNANEIRFSNDLAFDSYVRVGPSARGTTVQDLHVTEAGILGSDSEAWHEMIEGSIQAAQDVTLEGTADGLNLFYDKVQQELVNPYSEWDVFFYNWTWKYENRAMLPADEAWKKEYAYLAKTYVLEMDPVPKYNLTQEQFYWYYLKVLELGDKIVQENPFSIEEAFRGSGNTYFNSLQIEQALQSVPKEYWVERGVTIWKRPNKGSKYVIGIDPETGEGADDACISVWDYFTFEQVAEISGKFRPEETALIAVELGYYYNEALIGCETNGNGIATLNELRKLEYGNLYKRLVPDPDNMRGVKVPKYGFVTTLKNRPIMTSEFRADFERGEIPINSAKLLNQMKTFVRKDNGRLEHEDGKHDDCLFAAMIAYYIRNHEESEGSLIY